MINIPKINDEDKTEITLPKLMKTKEVCNYFGIHRTTLDSWSKSKKLNPIKIKHSKWYKLDEIKSLVE